ncbi:uncharacterized protein [Diadema antillarum]|uniref:uncharacterized protein n=1 Tax=Diadema antillarum TaxID=105358 RepID=UPI003A8803CD
MTNHSTNTTMTTSRTLRQTDFLPTKFSGGRLDYNDCTAHILTFEDYLDAHHIDSDKAGNLTTILKTFKRTLEGQARLWIDKLTFNTYDDLKTAFIRRFSPAKSTFARVTDFNTMTMTDGESVETFLQRLRQTASYIDYGEKQIKDRLLAALTPDCRAAILMASPTSTTTPDEIAAKAQLFIDLRTDTTSTKEVTFATQDDVDLLSEEISSLRFKTEQKDSRGRRRNRHSQHNDSDGSTSRSASRIRHMDDHSRHERSLSRDRYHSDYRRSLSRDRRHDSRDRHPGRRSPSRDRYRSQSRGRDQRSRPRFAGKCDYCHIPGHFWMDCRHRLRDIERDRRPQYYGPPPSHRQQYNDYN